MKWLLLLLVFTVVGCEKTPDQIHKENERYIQMKAERLNREAKERQQQDALEQMVRIKQYELNH